MRFSNERGKFTPVQKKNKGAFKRLLKKQLQKKQYTVPFDGNVPTDLKTILRFCFLFVLTSVSYTSFILESSCKHRVKKKKKEWNVLMIHLNYWDTKPHIFQQKGVFVSFPFFKGIKRAPRNTWMCNCQLFQSNKRQQLNNLTIISNEQ